MLGVWGLKVFFYNYFFIVKSIYYINIKICYKYVTWLPLVVNPGSTFHASCHLRSSGDSLCTLQGQMRVGYREPELSSVLLLHLLLLLWLPLDTVYPRGPRQLHLCQVFSQVLSGSLGALWPNSNLSPYLHLVLPEGEPRLCSRASGTRGSGSRASGVLRGGSGVP